MAIIDWSAFKHAFKINWIGWSWWRRTLCYYFKTCNRCLAPHIFRKEIVFKEGKPYERTHTLCKSCNKDLDNTFGKTNNKMTNN